MIEVEERERRWIRALLPELVFASAAWLGAMRSWSDRGPSPQITRRTRAAARELGDWLDRHPSPARLRPVVAELRSAVQEIHTATTIQLRGDRLDDLRLTADGCLLIARAARRLEAAQRQLTVVLQ